MNCHVQFPPDCKKFRSSCRYCFLSSPSLRGELYRSQSLSNPPSLFYFSGELFCRHYCVPIYRRKKTDTREYPQHFVKKLGVTLTVSSWTPGKMIPGGRLSSASPIPCMPLPTSCVHTDHYTQHCMCDFCNLHSTY